MAQARQKTRNNHYVPQFYLKQWSNNGNSVLCYDTIVRHEGQRLWRPAAIKNIACWKDFYSQRQDEEIDDSIEQYIERHYETPAKACLQKLSNGVELNNNDLTCLVDFAILQMARTPAWYNKTNAITADIFADVMEESVRGTLEDYKANRLDKLSFYNGYAEEHQQEPFPNTPIETRIDEEESGIVSTISIGRQNYLASMGRTLNGEIAKILRSYDWTILQMPEGYDLPTSDNPFTRLAYRGKNGYDLDGALGVPRVDLFMPLTPHHLLFVEVGAAQKAEPFFLWNEAARNLIIHAIVDNASQYVFSKFENDAIIAMRPRIVDPGYVDAMRENVMHWDELQS